MRWVAVAVVAGLAVGCVEKPPAPPTEQPATKAPDAASAPAAPAPPVAVVTPGTDGRPPEFDPSDPGRTLRWFAVLTEESLRPGLNRQQIAVRSQSVQNALAQCPGKTVRWKLAVERTAADGGLAFAPLRWTVPPGRAGQPPAVDLRVLPWNAANLDPTFKCPPDAGLSNVRPGQDGVTVQGKVTAINVADLGNWFVLLDEVRFNPGPDAGSSLRTDNSPPGAFDTDDPDKAFAWLRQQFYEVADPFRTPAERGVKKRNAESRLRSLNGKQVRWRWPVTVTPDSRVSVEVVPFYDYPHQVSTVMGLFLRQPRSPGRAGQPAAARGLGYDREFPPPGGTPFPAEVLAKIRSAGKATVSGKVALVTAADGGVYPPRGLEIAVRLDDIVIEP